MQLYDLKEEAIERMKLDVALAERGGNFLTAYLILMLGNSQSSKTVLILPQPMIMCQRAEAGTVCLTTCIGAY